jgi:DNA-binding SARP family transcriptional activator/Tfp pilus assembly protein PilF
MMSRRRSGQGTIQADTMPHDTLTNVKSKICLYLLGQTRLVSQAGDEPQALRIQRKPLHLLAYLALNLERFHRREALQALFWPDKSPRAAANNLRQALWHLRQVLPPDTLHLQGDEVGWNPMTLPWVDAQAFEAAVDRGDLEAALALYGGPLLPDVYAEWAQMERERLHLRYLTALECRARQRYEARLWQAALDDAETLLVDDPLNESATHLSMACYWALEQREAARCVYGAYRERVRQELGGEPSRETTALCQRILRGEPHPDQISTPAEPATTARNAHLSLLETLGAFHQGLEQAATWAAESSPEVRAMALRWRGRFHLRLGQLAEAHEALVSALSLAVTPGLQAAILTELATTETGQGNYERASARYSEALALSPLPPATRLRLLSSLGGLQGRLGRSEQARQVLEEAVSLARMQNDPAALARASGNLGILYLGQGEPEAAQAALAEALDAARRADAHWLTAHISGHLGLLAQDRDDLETAAREYRRARLLAETIGDQRGAVLWTLNLGVVRYEQGRYAEALPLLEQGREQAVAQGVRSLEAGAAIFIGACLVDQGQGNEGLAEIERGRALAQEIGDQERILIGLLHRGRALAALDRHGEARAALAEGLHQAQVCGMHRLERYFCAELEILSPGSPST